jgi:hypothetical protein
VVEVEVPLMSVPLLFLAAALAISAPAGEQPTSAGPKPSSNTPPPVPAKVSVEGCVALEAEIPGRKTTLGERTGLDRHFLLSRSKVVKGTAPAAGSGSMGEAAAFAPLYKISGLTDEQLKIHVGRRVRIEGSFGSLESAAAPAATSEQPDLVDLNVATIRQVPGDCAVPKS